MRGITEALRRSPGTHVFVHGIRSVGEMPGINLTDDESQRAVLLARAGDVVMVPTPVEPADARALAAVGKLAAAGPVFLNPFIASPAEWRLARKLQETLEGPIRVLGAPPEVVRRVNLKHEAREKAIACGVPVAPGEVVHLPVGSEGRPSSLDALEEAVRRQLSETGRVVVKGSFGASGSATFIVEGTGRIGTTLESVAARGDNTVYLVEPLLTLSAAPNVLMWIDPDDGEISCVSSTDQLLSPRLVFEGSAFPSAAKLLPQMIEGARRL
nr:hypothetical protein [Gemmatimonadota bacterium]